MPRKREPALANSVKNLRTQGGITQQELADQVGVTRQTIIALEGEAYTPSLALALKVAQVFGKPVDKVFWFER